ncbi:unnamed protein product, partial [Scytosiphon promiscuus]
LSDGKRNTKTTVRRMQQGDGMEPPLFSLILVPIVLKLQEKYEPLGVSFKAYMDDITLHLKVLTEESVQAMTDLVSELDKVGIVVNRAKSSALPPPGHVITEEQRRLLEGVGLTVAGEGITVVGVPIGTDDYVKEFAMKVIAEGGADKLARILPRMSDRQ